MVLIDMQTYKADSLPMAKEISETAEKATTLAQIMGSYQLSSFEICKPAGIKKAKAKPVFTECFYISSTGFESFDSIAADAFSGQAAADIFKSYYSRLAKSNEESRNRELEARASRNKKSEYEASLDK